MKISSDFKLGLVIDGDKNVSYKIDLDYSSGKHFILNFGLKFLNCENLMCKLQAMILFLNNRYKVKFKLFNQQRKIPTEVYCNIILM